MQLLRAIRDELARSRGDALLGAIAEPPAAYIDGWHDHHGRRFASAAERGYRDGVSRSFRMTTSDLPGRIAPRPSSDVGVIFTISPPMVAHALFALAISASRRPFHAIASPPTRRNGSRYSMIAPSVPTARAVPTS